MKVDPSPRDSFTSKEWNMITMSIGERVTHWEMALRQLDSDCPARVKEVFESELAAANALLCKLEEFDT